jgi:alpha-1,3-glucan synthase
MDAPGQFSPALRRCARGIRKDDFFLPREIAGDNNMGSIRLGRARQSNQWLDSLTVAVTLSNKSNSKHFPLDKDQSTIKTR